MGLTARQYYESIRKDREEWAKSRPQKCMDPHCPAEKFVHGVRMTLEVHEIERRSQAQRKWGHRCNYLLLCRACHQTSYASMGHARQLAVKLIADPDHFDLMEWLRLKDPALDAPLRVTIRDVSRNLTLK